jgi:predicted ATPase/DNA-binding winged helix-turn-helix (wHTH) protein
MPSVQQRPIYSSGKWEVDLARRELRAFGKIVPVGGRAFDVLEVLVQSAGQLVTKDQLIDRVWGCAIIEENTIQAQICAIRKSFGPDRELLQTVSRRGYRLLGTWTTRECDRSAASIDLDTEQTSVLRLGSNLPVSTSALVGREIAVGQLQDLVSPNRLVTLAGPGGIRKTSLSLELARGLLPSFDGEICLVELNALRDPGRVPSAVGRILGLSPGDDLSSASIAHAIGKRRLLLVIDNCEHLLEATAALVGTILKICPNVSVLATSREALRVDGEHVYRVPALDVPAQDLVERESIMSHSAVRLFVAHIAALKSDLLLNRQDHLADLVGKLLVALDSFATEGRWRLLETIRVYALEKLAERGEAGQAMRNHAHYFERLVSAAASPSGSRISRCDFDRLGREIENVRAALDWSFAESGDPTTGVSLASGYTAVWLHLMAECRDRLQRALAFSEARQFRPRERLQMLIALGGALIFTMEPIAEIKAVLAEALGFAESLDDVNLDSLL